MNNNVNIMVVNGAENQVVALTLENAIEMAKTTGQKIVVDSSTASSFDELLNIWTAAREAKVGLVINNFPCGSLDTTTDDNVGYVLTALSRMFSNSEDIDTNTIKATAAEDNSIPTKPSIRKKVNHEKFTKLYDKWLKGKITKTAFKTKVGCAFTTLDKLIEVYSTTGSIPTQDTAGMVAAKKTRKKSTKTLALTSK